MEINEVDTTHFNKSINTYTLSIDKDGTWKKTMDYHISSVFPGIEEGETITYNHHLLYSENGTWSFMHKIKDVSKNKERIHLSLLNETYEHLGGTQTRKFADGSEITTEIASDIKDIKTYAEGEKSIIYDILMLKSKEMKWERTHMSDNTVSTQSDPNPLYNQTFELTEKIRWIAE